MRKSSLIKIIAMILALCMFLTSCNAISGVLEGVLEKVLGKDQEQFIEDDGSGDCHHAKTTLKNAKVATCEAEGYTGDKVCTSCNAVVEKGTAIPSTAHNTTLKNEKPATCSAEGYTGDKVCTDCGTIVEKGSAIPVTSHLFDEGMTTKLPTCMNEGTLTFTCTQCGATRSESLPTVAHDDRYHDMLDGTHNHTCTTCTLTENEAHVPTDEGRFVPASCEEKAYTEFICSICNGVYKVYDETSEPTGHAYGEWQVNEATCISEGSRYHECVTCGKSERITIDVDPNAHRHEFAGYEGEAPTCDTGAIEIYRCVICGNDFYTKEVPATGLHNYEDLENTGDGWVRKQCTTCLKVVSTFDASTLKEAEVKAEDIPEDVPFEVTTEKAAIEFPTDVIGQLKGGDDVKIGADVLTDEAKETAIKNATNLTPEEKKRLENVELYDFNVTIDGNALAGNFNTAVTVTIPYQLKEITDEDGNTYLEDKDGIVIWYVAEDGTITKITDVQYNEATGTVTFLAPHFSMYAVAYEETQEMKCRRGYHAYEVIMTVPASCSGYGFSTLQCTTCHRVTVDNITERLLHTYGDIIPANPTCASGDYDHKVCTVCGDVLNIRYYRELGHQLDKVATCTEGSHCSRCNKTVVMPLGHSWSEWRVVIAAGPTTNGLRVRYCLRCGEAERSETASTGDLNTLKFESYDELLEAIYDLVVGVDKASVEFTFEAQGYGLIGVTALIDKSGEDMLVLVNFTVDGEETGMAYYKNGVALIKQAGEYGTASIDSLFGVSIGVTAAYMQAYYNLLNPYVEMGITSVREQLSTYVDIAGEEINQLLAAAGIDYTAEEALALLDSIETVYAYVSLKLGYTTAAEMKDGVRIPTKADFVNIITAFMDSNQDENENTTYTTDIEALLAQFTELYDKLMVICNKTLEAALFELFGDKIAQLDPTVTDATALAGYLKTQLPGTLMVSEAIGVIEDVMLELGDMTLDELYSLINEVMGATYGQEFDVEAMIAEYYSLTLNDLFSGITDEDITAEDFYDQLAMMMQGMMLGDIPMGGASVGEYLAYVMYRLNSIPVDADLGFTVDADGKLVSLILNESATTVGEFGEEIVIHAITVTITRDDTIQVTKPEVFDPVDVLVDGSLDEDGNFVITGVPEDAELNMYLQGGYHADLDDILTKDADLSAKYGFDIYTAPESLWTRTETVASLVKINGKYYTYSATPVRGEYPNLDKYVCQMDLFEFLSDPASVLPDEDDAPIDYYNDMPFYASPVGYLMQIDGEWWVCDAHLTYTYDKNNTGIVNEKYYIGDLSPMYRFNEMFVDSPVDLSSVEDYYYDHYYWYDHVNFNVRIDLYLCGETHEFKGTADADGVRLVYIPEGHIEEKYDEIYNIGSEYRLTDYTYDGMHTNSNTAIVQINGEQTEKEIEVVYLYRYAPSYYFKVADGSYLHLDAMYNTSVGINGMIGSSDGKPTSGYIYTNVNTANLSTKELSDGNIMYVVGYAPAYICGYAEGEVTYGYVQISDKAYIRAYCLEQNGYMVEVTYEGCRNSTYINFGDLYNVTDYVNTVNGAITVSSELISKLLEDCAEPGEYFGIQLNATKKIGDDIYHFMFREFIEFNVDFNISLPGGSGTDRVDPFYALFGGYEQGDKYELEIYVDENGDLVITGADILGVRTEFGDSFPADPFLEYDREESEQTGLDIYSYTYYDTRGTTYLYKNGKYYNYGWWHNFAVQTKTLDQIMASWHIQDMRYCYTIYPDENTPEELHNKMVYSIYVGCVNDSDKHYGELFQHNTDVIELYGFIMDGELQILTGADVRGDSLVVFEGYKPFDAYMASLEVTESESLPCGERVIEGKIVDTSTVRIALKEPGYNVYYYIELFTTAEDKYVYGAEIIDAYVFIEGEADVEGNWVERRSYQETFCNGIYELVDFAWVNTHKYRAVKIGDIFYDYDEYYNNWYDQISDLEEFRQQMYNTDRVYRIWDDKIGDYRYYNKFIPGKYFQGDEELFDFVLPTDEYQQSLLGYTEDGKELWEIVYYIDETIDPEILEITLADGRKFYHVDGIGYVKLKEGHYVRAMLAYDSEGNPYAMCLYRKAYIWDYALSRTSGDGQFSMFEEYINRTSDSVTIPKEMLEYMLMMHEGAHFIVSTNHGEIHFNYYILEAYFRGEIGGGYGEDFNDKYEGDYKDEYDGGKYDDGNYDENGYDKDKEGK